MSKSVIQRVWHQYILTERHILLDLSRGILLSKYPKKFLLQKYHVTLRRIQDIGMPVTAPVRITYLHSFKMKVRKEEEGGGGEGEEKRKMRRKK